MKKYIITFVVILFGFTMQSQILLTLLFGDKLNSDGLEFGLVGGFNFSNISELEANKPLTSFNLGFYFDFRLKNQWNIYTGVLAKANLGDNKLTSNDLDFLGIEAYPENGAYSQKIKYFIIPAFLKYNFPNRLHVEFGPQFGLMYKSWVEFNSDIDHREIRIKDFNSDQINRLDAGLTLGTGYKFISKSGMTINLKYYYGLTNVYKGVDGSNNSSLFLDLNLPIGANKKKNLLD